MTSDATFSISSVKIGYPVTVQTRHRGARFVVILSACVPHRPRSVAGRTVLWDDDSAQRYGIVRALQHSQDADVVTRFS